ncbi:hypothetical protein IE81DRAFT_124391 [Ceraceosorus guamensis]|uniref:Dynactin subunit 6 n=1 Tax=Ceraceosorus guamensis TaxID=1522189 RepID=A0A316VXU2_9BASI|nr:hypothetical protein IE81DRAFT_124391 [Ceraceosorus guamensis]PWN42477.1 hypothetical protein IE81DRAFT_124391 [Ceraceosorus guamensis]
MPPLVDKLTVGSRVTIAADAELRGTISIGSGSVVHPRCTVLALSGAIVMGSNIIIEETCVIVNRSGRTMKIGDENLFEVGCRIEAISVGNNCVFEHRCKVGPGVIVDSFVTVGAACAITGYPTVGESNAKEAADILNETAELDGFGAVAEADYTNFSQAAAPKPDEVVQKIPPNTIVFGAGGDCRMRLWSGNGIRQREALHAKHLEYLRETFSKAHKLKVID